MLMVIEVAHGMVKGFKEGFIRADHVSRKSHASIGYIWVRDATDGHELSNKMIERRSKFGVHGV
jgi:hypothetical protein